MSNNDSTHMSRRNVLRTSGAAIGGGLLSTSTVTAGEATEDEALDDFQFDTVINAVDVGADPTGEEDIGPIIEEYAADNTLLYFPEGDYKFVQFRNNEGPWDEFSFDGYYPLNDFGIRGAGSDKTSWILPEGRGTEPGYGFEWERLAFEIRYGTNLLFEGIRLDNTAPNTGARFQIYADDGLVVRDVLTEGRFNGEVNCYSFTVYDEGGEGLLENVRAPDGADNPGPDYAGPCGMYIPKYLGGTLTIRNCHIEGFQDNGLYASNASDPGAIQVEGGLYANSNISNVRLGQSRSYVKNATIAVTEVIDTEYVTNMRGVRQQDGSGVTVKNCDIVYSADAPSSGAIVSAARTGDMTIENTRIHFDGPVSTNPINAKTPDNPDSWDRNGITVKNVMITSEGGDSLDEAGDVVHIGDRDDNVIENVCIEETGVERDGLGFYGSTGTVRNSRIDVTGEPIVVTDDGDVQTHNVRYEGNC